MARNLRKLILALCAVLAIGGSCVYWIDSRKMMISINDVPMKVAKDLIIDYDNKIYVDALEMLDLQEVPIHIGDFGITVLLSGSKVVRLNVEDNIAVINGQTLDLTNEDYIYEKEKLYLAEEMYRKLFEQAIIYLPDEKVKFEAYDVGKFKIPQGLTFGEYLSMTPKERQNLIVKNSYSKTILESQVDMLPGDELNPIIENAYNQVVWSFDFYKQYQFYNWHMGIDDSDGLEGYLLCSNAQTILGQFEDMKTVREIANIKEFTAKDIEYINRINTLYNAMDFQKVKLLRPAIESYISRLDSSDPGWDVYKPSAEEALEQFNRTFEVEKIDRLNIPAWADFDSYYTTLKYFPYIEQEKKLHDMLDEFLDVIPQNVKDAIDLGGNYKEIEEIILAAYPEWGEYLPGEVLVNELKEGSLKDLFKVIDDFEIVELYDSINLLSDVSNLMDMERDNDFFAELKKSKVDSAANILNKMIEPTGMIKSGLEMGNANLVSMGGILTLEFFVAKEVASRIEELGKFVSGMILMSLDTDSINDVYSGNITLEEYLDGE